MRKLLTSIIAVCLTLAASAQDEQYQRFDLLNVNGSHHLVTARSEKNVPDSLKLEVLTFKFETFGIKKTRAIADSLCEAFGKEGDMKVAISNNALLLASKAKHHPAGWIKAYQKRPGMMELKSQKAKKGQLFQVWTATRVWICRVVEVSSTKSKLRLPEYNSSKGWSGIQLVDTFPGGVASKVWHFQEGLMTREVSFYPNGQKNILAEVNNGQFSGEVQKFYETGRIKEKGVKTADGLQGEYKTWFPNGQVQSSSTFNKGVREGIYSEWWQNGIKKEEVFYVNGQIHGERKSWHQNGRLAVQAEFVAGKADGLTRKWFANGNLQVEAVYKNNLRNGRLAEFYENGQQKFEGSYANNKLHGDYKTYYEDGRLKSEGKAENGQVIEEKTY